jgi:hypothetical protein
MKNEPKPDMMTFMQTVTTVTVIFFALLLFTISRPFQMSGFGLLQFALGIVGLIFAGVALMAMSAFRAQWTRSSVDADDAPTFEVKDAIPLLFEVGLWALALLYVVLLVGIARG